VTLNRNLDGDSIENNIDTLPNSASTAFSDTLLVSGGVSATSGTIVTPMPAGSTLLLTDLPGAGLQAVVTTASPSDRVQLQLTGKKSKIKLAAGTYTIIDPVEDTIVSTQIGGPAEIELTLNGAPLVITIAQGATATITETTDGSGNLTNVAVTPAAGNSGAVTVNGQPVSPGQTTGFGTLSARLTLSRTTFDLTSVLTLAPGASISMPENLVFTIGNYSASIPASAFKSNKQGWAFTRTVNGVVLTGLVSKQSNTQYSVKISANGPNGAATSNPVSVSIAIGNDIATAKVTAKFT